MRRGETASLEIGFEGRVEFSLPVGRRGRGEIGLEASKGCIKGRTVDAFFLGKRPESLQEVAKARARIPGFP
jgi:hypothetical protein